MNTFENSVFRRGFNLSSLVQLSQGGKMTPSDHGHSQYITLISISGEGNPLGGQQ